MARVLVTGGNVVLGWRSRSADDTIVESGRSVGALSASHA